MARTKEELAKAIDNIFNTFGKEIKNPEEAAKLRLETASRLAEEIDSYVQYQIGSRLLRINFAINAVGVDGNPVPTTPGPEFDSFTRIT